MIVFSFTSMSLVVMECSPSSLETNTMADSSSSLQTTVFAEVRNIYHSFCGLMEHKGRNSISLQSSLLVGAVQACVSPREEQPVGVIGTLIKTINYHRGVMQGAAINNEIINDPHLLFLA